MQANNIDEWHSLQNKEQSSSKYWIAQPAFVGKLWKEVFQNSLWNLLIHRKAHSLTGVLARDTPLLLHLICIYLKEMPTKTPNKKTNKPTNKKPTPILHLFDRNNGQGFAMHIGRNISISNFSAVFGYQWYGICTEVLLVTVATEPAWQAVCFFLRKMWMYSSCSLWEQNIITLEFSFSGGISFMFTS